MRSLRFPTLVALLLAGLTTSGSVLAAETYEIDPVHSTIAFRIQHLGVAYTWGRFGAMSGQAVIDEQNPAASSVQVEVKVESIDTGDEKRDKHLRSPDFFDAKTFPVARFTSTSVRRKGDVYEITGTFELHGVEKTITLPLERVGSGKDPWGGYRTGFSGRTTIRRSDFGMKWGLGGPVGDEVELFFDLELIRQ